MLDEGTLSKIDNSLNEKYDRQGYLLLAEVYDRLGFDINPYSDVWKYAFIKGKGLCLLDDDILVNRGDFINKGDFTMKKIVTTTEIVDVDFK